jgi:hypothetical protein
MRRLRNARKNRSEKYAKTMKANVIQVSGQPKSKARIYLATEEDAEQDDNTLASLVVDKVESVAIAQSYQPQSYRWRQGIRIGKHMTITQGELAQNGDLAIKSLLVETNELVRLVIVPRTCHATFGRTMLETSDRGYLWEQVVRSLELGLDTMSRDGRHTMVINIDILTGLNEQERERRTGIKHQLESFTRTHTDVLAHLTNDIAAVRSLARFIKMRSDEEKKRAKTIGSQEKLYKRAKGIMSPEKGAARGSAASSLHHPIHTSMDTNQPNSYLKAATALDGTYAHYAAGLHDLGERLAQEHTSLKELESAISSEKGVLDKAAKDAVRRLKQADDSATKAFSQLERYSEGERVDLWFAQYAYTLARRKSERAAGDSTLLLRDIVRTIGLLEVQRISSMVKACVAVRVGLKDFFVEASVAGTDLWDEVDAAAGTRDASIISRERLEAAEVPAMVERLVPADTLAQLYPPTKSPQVAAAVAGEGAVAVAAAAFAAPATMNSSNTQLLREEKGACSMLLRMFGTLRRREASIVSSHWVDGCTCVLTANHYLQIFDSVKNHTTSAAAAAAGGDGVEPSLSFSLDLAEWVLVGSPQKLKKTDELHCFELQQRHHRKFASKRRVVLQAASMGEKHAWCVVLQAATDSAVRDAAAPNQQLTQAAAEGFSDRGGGRAGEGGVGGW